MSKTQLMAERVRLLKEVAEATEATALRPADESEDEYRRACEACVALYDRRAGLFEAIRAVDEQLGGDVDDEARAAARILYDIDTRNADTIGMLSEFVRKNVKELNSAKLVMKYTELEQ